MFIPAMEVLHARYDLSWTEAAVLREIMKLWSVSASRGVKDLRGNTYVYAGHRYFAERVERSERTIDRVIRVLKRKGLISVFRTTRNAHIRLTDFCLESCVASGGDKNGGSIYNPNNLSITDNLSGNAGNDSDFSIAATAPTAKKTAPTPKRPKPSKAVKMNSRRMYLEHLRKMLRLNAPFCYRNYDDRTDVERAEALAETIADAVSVENGRIPVNGRLLTTNEYWSVAQNFKFEAMADLFDRLERAVNVRNPRAYTLAAVYNSALHDEITDAIPYQIRFAI